MNYEIVNFESKDRWSQIVEKIGNSQLENQYNFINIFKKYKEEYIPELFYYKNRNSEVAYIYIKKKYSKNNFYHIFTPYCYGGFIINDESERFFSSFREEFNNYALKNKIITEFVRLHPMTFKCKDYFKHYFDIFKLHSENLYFDTKLSDNSFPYHNRKKRHLQIAKSNKELIFKFDDKLNFNQFFKIYNDNMKRKNVTGFLNFNKYFFDLINNNIKNSFYFPTVSFNNKIIAAAIFLKNKNFLDLYLAASDYDYLDKNANTLLFYEFVENIKKNYEFFQKIHLGGGSDNLKFFKSNFADTKKDYYIIKNIVNKNEYFKISNEKNLKKILESEFPDKKLI